MVVHSLVSPDSFFRNLPQAGVAAIDKVVSFEEAKQRLRAAARRLLESPDVVSLADERARGEASVSNYSTLRHKRLCACPLSLSLSLSRTRRCAYARRELARWDEYIRVHPAHLLELKEKKDKWHAENLVANEAARS